MVNLLSGKTMDHIQKKNLSLLESMLGQAIPPEGRISSNIDNPKIKSLVNTIFETGLSFVIDERIDAVGDEELDNTIQELKNVFYTLTSQLKQKGFIEIHGNTISKKTNI